MANNAHQSNGSAIAQNGVFEWVARAGFVASGLVHLAIGYITVRIALGGQGGSADQSGAFAELAAERGGRAALWVAAAALLALALWRVVETFLGRAYDPTTGKELSLIDRAQAFSLAVIYFGFAYSAYGFATGTGTSSGQQTGGVSARLMESSLGKAALVVVGAVVVAIGGYHIYKGASKHFLDDLMGRTSKLVRNLGMVGYIAKGTVLAGVGVLVIVAALTSDPRRASGLDVALKELGAQPYGMFMLVAAGAGLFVYGLYSIVMARSAKM
jgi:hypothetical protein